MITDDTAWLLVEASRILNKSFRELQIAELGNQWSGWKLSAPVKLVMEWLGANHSSFDINGLDGAIPLDLSKPITDEYVGRFDLVTNYGTTEHVATTLDLRDQYEAFKNIDDLAKVSACMIHVVPSEQGAHCGCGYIYSHKFFHVLQRVCHYELLECYDSKSDKDHIAALLLSDGDSRFPKFEEFAITIGKEIIRV